MSRVASIAAALPTASANRIYPPDVPQSRSRRLQPALAPRLAPTAATVAIPRERAAAVPAGSVANVESLPRLVWRRPDDADERSPSASAADRLEDVLRQSSLPVDQP